MRHIVPNRCRMPRDCRFIALSLRRSFWKINHCCRMRTFSGNSRGFSLLEVLVATFIFSIVMAGATQYFVNITVSNQNVRRLQQNLESVQFAMNRIAKSLRTSTVISPSSNQQVSEVRVFDYSQRTCFRYGFEGNGVTEYSALLPAGVSDEKAWCASLGSASFTSNVLVSAADGMTVVGRFAVYPSSETVGSELAGRITMNATVSQQNNSSTIQTTVSLRNYREVAS